MCQVLSGQGEQSALPIVSLYVPSTHAVAAAPSTPVYPGFATQSFALVLAVNVCEVLSGQGEQSALPVVSLYFPGAHGVAGPPAGP